ncbi:myogenic factor [Holotrichia oblita]|uniref:Myogenic factor n=1 Tax=Holotrichia oblita TaxID=644536 RepID=A0ACB9SLW1_HOLOL|nr:myogenic factor [Holotrichia oblita]
MQILLRQLVYIELPEANTLTDENSGDEDDGGLADNLSRHQLLARAEIIVQNNNDDVAVEYSEQRPGKMNISWIEGDLVPSQKMFPKESNVAFNC